MNLNTLINAGFLLDHGGVFLAQATGLDAAIGKGMGIIARIAYLGAFGMIIAASWNVQKGQSEAAKWSIMGALIGATASLIVKALFATGEAQINITPS